MSLLTLDMKKAGRLLCQFYRIHDNDISNEEEYNEKLSVIADKIYQQPSGVAEDYITVMGDEGKLLYDMDISYVMEYSPLYREANKDYYKDMHWLPRFGISKKSCNHIESIYTCMSCAYIADVIGDTDPNWNVGILEQLRKENNGK